MERAARQATARAATRRVEPRQQAELGVGTTILRDPRFFARASWQYTFRPFQGAGSLLGVPLQVALQFGPSPTLLGSVSAGAGGSLGALKIPANVRLLVGAAGGQALGKQGIVPIAGPKLGGGVGAELGRWRIQLDADHVFNLLNRSQVSGVTSLSLSGGGSF